jgi:hypothetical protein
MGRRYRSSQPNNPRQAIPRSECQVDLRAEVPPRSPDRPGDVSPTRSGTLLGVVRHLPAGLAGAALHPPVAPARAVPPSRWPGGERDRSCDGARTGPRGGRWTAHEGRAEHDGRPHRRRPRTSTGRPPANASLDLGPLDLDGGIGSYWGNPRPGPSVSPYLRTVHLNWKSA